MGTDGSKLYSPLKVCALWDQTGIDFLFKGGTVAFMIDL